MRLLEVHDLCRQRHFFQLSCFSISKLSSSLVSKITCDDGLQFVQDRAASSKFKPCISFAYRESRTVCDYLSALFCRVTPEQVVRCTRAKAHNDWYGDVRPSLGGTGEPGTMRALLEVAISAIASRGGCPARIWSYSRRQAETMCDEAIRKVQLSSCQIRKPEDPNTPIGPRQHIGFPEDAT